MIFEFVITFSFIVTIVRVGRLIHFVRGSLNVFHLYCSNSDLRLFFLIYRIFWLTFVTHVSNSGTLSYTLLHFVGFFVN